ncbi:MAG: protein-glutamate O-methyltransferase CheR [Alphaproteobacteria bacterium]|nr:protein-glutamate O-methyltransferase CheR [Alphaproteobacteria bacterium]
MSVTTQAFLTFVAARTGVCVPPERQYMIDSRLAGLVREAGAASIEPVLEAAMSGEDAQLTHAVLDAMMMGETLFFRDRQVFASLADTVIPGLVEARSDIKRLRIWSAACARGQEPYSIAMLLEDKAARLRGWQVELLASDISHSAIKQAREGYFNQFEVQRGLPVNLLLRHFHREGEQWRIAEHMRSLADFRQHNLLTDDPSLGRFDLILCRNVLMYFDAAKRRDVLARLKRHLVPGGVLLLGATESIIGPETELQPVTGFAGGFRLRANAGDMGRKVA